MGNIRFRNDGTSWRARLCAFGEKLHRRPPFQYKRRVSAQSETLEPASCGPYSILIAGCSNKTTLLDILLRARHRVSILEDARMILDAADLSDFDLIIMDVNIPEMSGIEVIKLYRFMSLGLRYIPIIAVGPNASEEHCKDAGIDACIGLSAGERNLLDIVDRLIASVDKNSRRVSHYETAQYQAMTRPGCAAAPIDMDGLKSLIMLGGLQFVDDLISAFLDEAPIILCVLRQAILASDSETFHEQMHLLRSHAANIGAGGLYQMCSEWDEATPENIRPSSDAIFSNLRCEFDRVSVALQKMLREQRLNLTAHMRIAQNVTV
jgi:two-component system, sensor histidine kinase RpfC